MISAIYHLEAKVTTRGVCLIFILNSALEQSYKTKIRTLFLLGKFGSDFSGLVRETGHGFASQILRQTKEKAQVPKDLSLGARDGT